METTEYPQLSLAVLRIIIIEDEVMLALCLGEVIEDEGCVVVGTAGTLKAANALAATGAYDIAIVDLHLHGKPANDVAATIIRSGHAIVISTGSDSTGVPVEFQQWPVLRKPFANAAIFAVLKCAAEIRSFTLVRGGV